MTPSMFSKSLSSGVRQDIETVSFSFYYIDAFFKNFLVNVITAPYDDVITKNDGANFTVKFLLNWKINEILNEILSSKKDMHLKISQNVIYKMGNTLKKKNLFSYRSSLFFYCSLLFSNNETIGR